MARPLRRGICAPGLCCTMYSLLFDGASQTNKGVFWVSLVQFGWNSGSKRLPYQRPSRYMLSQCSNISQKQGTKSTQYEDKVHYVAVLTAAATNKPKSCSKPRRRTPRGVYADPSEPELLREKIRIILRMASYHGHSRIVLGAIGYGVFCNPILPGLHGGGTLV